VRGIEEPLNREWHKRGKLPILGGKLVDLYPACGLENTEKGKWGGLKGEGGESSQDFQFPTRLRSWDLDVWQKTKILSWMQERREPAGEKKKDYINNLPGNKFTGRKGR